MVVSRLFCRAPFQREVDRGTERMSIVFGVPSGTPPIWLCLLGKKSQMDQLCSLQHQDRVPSSKTPEKIGESFCSGFGLKTGSPVSPGSPSFLGGKSVSVTDVC